MRDCLIKIAEPILFNRVVGERMAGYTVDAAVQITDAFLEAMPDMIPDLEFWSSDTGDLCADTLLGRYQIQKGETRYCMMPAMGMRRHRTPSPESIPTYHKSAEGAKSAANAHHKSQVMAMLGLGKD